MKKNKSLIVLLVIFIILDFVLVFIDDGNHIETVTYNAKVLSCSENSNSGLDSYYVVEYEYSDNGKKVKDKDSFYKEKVEKGDKIKVSKRKTVTSSYAKYIFYATILCNVIVGVLGFMLIIRFVKDNKSVKK